MEEKQEVLRDFREKLQRETDLLAREYLERKIGWATEEVEVARKQLEDDKNALEMFKIENRMKKI